MRVETGAAGGRLWRLFRRAMARVLNSRERRARLRLVSYHRASERARRLLLQCLNASQRAEFERTGAFTVRGPSGQSYRIGFGTIANVEVVGERGELLYRLCAGPTELPTPAVMLAQKLMLESRELEFLRIAARHPGLAAPPARPSGNAAAELPSAI